MPVADGAERDVEAGEALGYAAEVLLASMDASGPGGREPSGAFRHTLDTRLVERASVAPPPSA